MCSGSSSVSTAGIPLQEMSPSPSAFTGRNFRNWLMDLRNSHSLIKSSRSALIDRLLEGYDSARHGTGVRCHSNPGGEFNLCVPSNEALSPPRFIAGVR